MLTTTAKRPPRSRHHGRWPWRHTHQVLNGQYVSVKVGPPMGHFDGHNPLSGGEWTKEQKCFIFNWSKAGSFILLYKQHNREMSSWSKLTSEPTFCLTHSPPSSKWESLFQQSLFFFSPQVMTLKSQQLWTFLGNSGYYAWEPASLCKHKGNVPPFPLRKSFFHILTSSSPPTLTLTLTFLSSNSFVPSSSITSNTPWLPEPLRTIPSLESKRLSLSSFALRTTGCQAMAAALSALGKESRYNDPGNRSTRKIMPHSEQCHADSTQRHHHSRSL